MIFSLHTPLAGKLSVVRLQCSTNASQGSSSSVAAVCAQARSKRFLAVRPPLMSAYLPAWQQGSTTAINGVNE